MAVSPIPAGYHTITPYLIVANPDRLIRFLTEAFSATIHEQMPGPAGETMHADIQVGTSHVMMGRASDAYPARSAMLYLYVEDCEGWYQQALAAGATSTQEPRLEFYGDKTAAVKGPEGNDWYFATHVEDVAPDELARRAAEAKRG